MSPIGVAKDLLRLAMSVLSDEELDFSFSQSSSASTERSIPRAVRTPPGPLGSFVRRVVLGIPVVGVASLVQMLWTMSMLTPFHFFTRLRGRGNSRRERSRDIATVIILIAIVAGALRCVLPPVRVVIAT